MTTLSYFLSTISFLLILSELFITKQIKQINFQNDLDDVSGISRSEVETTSSKEDLETNDIDLIGLEKNIEPDDEETDDEKELVTIENINAEEINERDEIDDVIEISLENKEIENIDLNQSEKLELEENPKEEYEFLSDEINAYSDVYVNEEIESELVDTIAEFDSLLNELKNKIKKDAIKS